MDSARARAIADRRTGVGCDQVILLEPSEIADVKMRIWNADGGEVEACGNAARCVAMLGAARTIETQGGLLAASANGADATSTWARRSSAGRIFRSPTRWTRRAMPVGWEDLQEPCAVNVGNPHLVFFVEDADAIDLARLGPLIERDPLFPEASMSTSPIGGGMASTASCRPRLRVWERGAGLTAGLRHGGLRDGGGRDQPASGSLSPVEVRLPGGALIDRLGARRHDPDDRPGHPCLRRRADRMSVEVITLGCRLNMAESEAMRALAAARRRSRSSSTAARSPTRRSARPARRSAGPSVRGPRRG